MSEQRRTLAEVDGFDLVEAGVKAFDVIVTPLTKTGKLSKRAKAAGLLQRVLIEVNVGREPQKAGVLPENVAALLAEIGKLPALSCAGLMCIPPAQDDPRPHFRSLRNLGQALDLPELSMGMTADFETAIEEGATLVRIGTAIFGERPPVRS